MFAEMRLQSQFHKVRAGVPAFALLAVLACGGEPPVVREAPRPATTAARAAGTIDVVVRTPAHAVWAASTLGAPKPTLRIVVTNHSAEGLDVSNLRVFLDAIREGTTFRCENSAGPEAMAREPASLLPGASFAFERVVDCALPLTGRYAVRVSVSFGVGAWQERRPVQTSSLTVTAGSRDEPRMIEAVPGLWAALGASPIISGETRAGHGRIAVLLVNSGARPIMTPPLRLALRVYRAGTSLPCEDEPITLLAPPTLMPSQSYRQSFEISCLGLHTPGVYEVAGRIVGVGDDVEIGRLRIEISDDPSRLEPLTPVRSWR